MTKISNEIWAVIKEYLETVKGKQAPDILKDILEQHTEIEVFDGGVFIAMDNEFDLFVLPEKRGRWRIRTTISDYLNRMMQKHGTIIVSIDERNAPSLRLARHFGFNEVSRNNGVIRLEKKHGRHC